MVMALVITTALMVGTHDAGSQSAWDRVTVPDQPGFHVESILGFTLKITVKDFLKINKALMQLKPDDQADRDQTLALLKKLRGQMDADAANGPSTVKK